MDFLKNILNRILRNGGYTFREQVKKEKKQKYLFRQDAEKKHVSPRNSNFLKKKKQEISRYTSIFTGSFEFIHNHARESKVLAYMGVFLIFLSFYIIVFSPYFKISPNKVLIEADTPGIDINIAYRSLEDVYGKSIFLLDEETTAISLKKSLKNIARIRIEKLYPNGVKVLISGAPIRYTAYITGIDKRYGMSENGVLVPESAIGSGNTDTIEIDSETLRSEPFLDYKQALPDDKVLMIGKILTIFHDEWSDLVLGKSRYFAAENELHLSLESGTKIILTLQNDANSSSIKEKMDYVKQQLITLKNYITSHRKDLTDGSITYIDARINRKLFICGERATCTQNLVTVYGQIYAQ